MKKQFFILFYLIVFFQSVFGLELGINPYGTNWLHVYKVIEIDHITYERNLDGKVAVWFYLDENYRDYKELYGGDLTFYFEPWEHWPLNYNNPEVKNVTLCELDTWPSWDGGGDIQFDCNRIIDAQQINISGQDYRPTYSWKISDDSLSHYKQYMFKADYYQKNFLYSIAISNEWWQSVVQPIHELRFHSCAICESNYEKYLILPLFYRIQSTDVPLVEGGYLTLNNKNFYYSKFTSWNTERKMRIFLEDQIISSVNVPAFWAIIGAVIGSLLGLILSAILSVHFYKKQEKMQKQFYETIESEYLPYATAYKFTKAEIKNYAESLGLRIKQSDSENKVIQKIVNERGIDELNKFYLRR